MANVKPQLKYRVVNGYNPKTRGTCKRPKITERETYVVGRGWAGEEAKTLAMGGMVSG